ncbi:MAG TPA: M20/M25/M40 family metallo-hydrolase [Spirochaetales bacterium]|nr:M20/M25/M40 family metallo-hydrolase [Spirochaetales bacterium]
MEKAVNFNDVQALSIALTKMASVTDSPGEKAFPTFLASLLQQLPYFREYPENIQTFAIPNDEKERSNLFALVKGTGPSCVILTGHYDVVQTSMYGSLEPWAFDPETLLKKFLALSDKEKTDDRPSNQDSPMAKLLHDLESGEFLPGRGILDMKSGLAAGLAVLARFAAPLEREGNILFLTVPDEEGSSHGMKAASAMLPHYLEERGLVPSVIINLDAAVDQEGGESGRAVFTGSVGKLLPFVYFIGKCSHAGAPFDGINPVLAASEFAQAVECNPDFLQERQSSPGEEPPPPTILYFRESRQRYDVTTPDSVFVAMNILTHSKSPQEVLELVSKAAFDAMNRSISTLRERASTMARRVSGHFFLPVRTPRVLSFEELAALAEHTSPGILEKTRAYAISKCPEDQVQQTLLVLKELVPFSNIEGPAVIVGFAPPYYARAELDKAKYLDFVTRLRAELLAFSQQTGKSVRVRPFFPGISDMSFLAPADTVEQRAYVRSQSAILDSSASEETRITIDCPVINAGPWGRDYHQMGERINIQYGFKELPELLWRLVNVAFDVAKEQHDER